MTDTIMDTQSDAILAIVRDLKDDNERLRKAIEDAPCPMGHLLRPSFVVGKLNIYCDTCPDCWKRQALEQK